MSRWRERWTSGDRRARGARRYGGTRLGCGHVRSALACRRSRWARNNRSGRSLGCKRRRGNNLRSLAWLRHNPPRSGSRELCSAGARLLWPNWLLGGRRRRDSWRCNGRWPGSRRWPRGRRSRLRDRLARSSNRSSRRRNRTRGSGWGRRDSRCGHGNRRYRDCARCSHSRWRHRWAGDSNHSSLAGTLPWTRLGLRRRLRSAIARGTGRNGPRFRPGFLPLLNGAQGIAWP